MIRTVTVVGARPQFIKAAMLGRALRSHGHIDVLVHTGQHYDERMSGVFFDELGIPRPDVNLAIGSDSHGAQTGRMLMGLERVLLEHRPDFVIVHGDTNSTLAGALAACKLGIPIAHVEAGLRSFNRSMPEEHNRVLTDHCSDLLFCPTQTAVANLEREGIRDGVCHTGDIMYDAVLHFTERARERSTILTDLGLTPGSYLLATVHRPYNTDRPANLLGIVDALRATGEPCVFPMHPRTREKLTELNSRRVAPTVPGGSDLPDADGNGNIRFIQPIGYFDMLTLQANARLVLTDSGGMQKESFFLRVPCITLRPETEWVETVQSGWNVLADADGSRILEAVRCAVRPRTEPPPVFGDGNAADQMVAALEHGLAGRSS